MKSFLHQILFDRKINKQEFSEMTKLHYTTINKVYENNFNDITMRPLLIMCSTLEIAFEELIDIKSINNAILNLNEKKNLTELKVS